jgi:DNA-binding NarL/FixJ family response regulator
VIRVLLADDENLIRSALASLLAIQEDIEVVAQAASGDEALAMARRYRPDVAVLDLQMPGLDRHRRGAGHRAARVRQPDPDQLRAARAPQAGPRRRRARVSA